MEPMIYNFEKFFEMKNEKDLTVIYHEIPESVKDITISILQGIFDKVKKPFFYMNNDNESFVEFGVTGIDFRFIDETQKLEMDLSDNVKKKRDFDVILEFVDKFDDDDEYTVLYKIDYTETIDNEDMDDEDMDDEDMDDEDMDDDWYKPDEDLNDEIIDDEKFYNDNPDIKLNINDEDLDDEN
jgi:hypothetical protein